MISYTGPPRVSLRVNSKSISHIGGFSQRWIAVEDVGSALEVTVRTDVNGVSRSHRLLDWTRVLQLGDNEGALIGCAAPTDFSGRSSVRSQPP